jgi:phosphatidylserine/phosphatidylglycerophosphate/cardiolipin synthase-like enzyme
MERDGNHIPSVTSGAYPIRSGNAVRPLVDGEPAFRRICEAVEAAQHSAWITVAFIERDVQMPDGRGSFFDVLDRAKTRGIDVRVIFWRCPELEGVDPGVHFSGTEEERAWLLKRGSKFLARWDRAAKRYCQHQKSWLIDAGQAGEVAFVGGINLGQNSVVPQGHPEVATVNASDSEGDSVHDVYVEIQGPSASDVHHNFVQRWNEASERDLPDGLWPDASSQSLLPFPEKAGPEAGEVAVQIQRTVRRGLYTDSTATPGGERFEIADGDPSILDQYMQAIDAAKRTIYIEDQALGSMEFVEGLHRALERGVEVVFLIPAEPYGAMVTGRANPESAAFFKRMGELGEHDHFALVGIASHRRGSHRPVYIHAKIALIDDVWATIGSTNIGNRSFYGDTELNASFWHGPTVRALRENLLLEHTGRDTHEMDDRSALRMYREVARENARRRDAGGAQEGLAFALDPATYGS